MFLLLSCQQKLNRWLCHPFDTAKLQNCIEKALSKLLNINKITFLIKKVEESGEKWGKFCTFVSELLNNISTHMRFLGNIEAKTDTKGRVFLPATFRRVLQTESSEMLVLRKDIHEECLVLYPESVWNEQMDSLRSRLNRWNRQHQQVFRQFVSEAETVTLDGNGRFLISRRLLETAGINQAVRFIGVGDTIEIWAVHDEGEPFMEATEFGQAMENLMESI